MLSKVTIFPFGNDDILIWMYEHFLYYGTMFLYDLILQPLCMICAHIHNINLHLAVTGIILGSELLNISHLGNATKYETAVRLGLTLCYDHCYHLIHQTVTEDL